MFFFFKQKTAYELRISDWSSDVCSSDLDTYSAGGFPNSASVEDPIIINSAVSNADNDRYGFTASNRFSPPSALDFLLEGSWQHEKLRSDDESTDAVADGWRPYLRAGRRGRSEQRRGGNGCVRRCNFWWAHAN